MKLAHNFPRRTGRAAFTLVELLVVIAIIIVLASLLLAAVFKALDMAYEAQTRTDITQLGAALQSFETKYGVNYVPSRIILCENPANYFNPSTGQAWTQLHQDSLDYLQRVFPRISSPTLAQSQWALAGIDWNGDGVIQDLPMACPGFTPTGLSVYNPATGTSSLLSCNGFLLEGEQCLVFFAGGIPRPTPSGVTMTGFATNPSNPADLNSDRVPPFFDFKSDRLLQWVPQPPYAPPGVVGTAPGFPSYKDGYGKTPYAFFSSYKTSNGYNRYVNISNPYMPLNPTPPGAGPASSDCQALPFPLWQGNPPTLVGGTGVWPYAQFMAAGGPPVYLNPQTYQIISAGKDLNFGTGTVVFTYPGAPTGTPFWSGAPQWTPQSATAVYPQANIRGIVGGYDDIANFYDRLLGVPTQ